MDDAGIVRGFERQGDLMRDGQRLVGRDRALRDAVGERGSFDQFQHERRLAILLLEAVDGRDVRVVQRGQDLGFALEPREACGIGRHRRRQDLDRHVAFQLAVARAIDLAHSAFAQLRDDFVGAEAVPASGDPAGLRRDLAEVRAHAWRARTRADLRGDFVGAEAGAGRESQTWSWTQASDAADGVLL